MVAEAQRTGTVKTFGPRKTSFAAANSPATGGGGLSGAVTRLSEVSAILSLKHQFYFIFVYLIVAPVALQIAFVWIVEE